MDKLWQIGEVAKLAGTTSRTLRHYDRIGLLPASDTTRAGLRLYDQAAIVRLQRILLLRQLGLGLPRVAEVLAGQTNTIAALGTHRRLLERERERLGRQLASIDITIDKLQKGEPLMADEALGGFDNSSYEDEVVARWGQPAYDDATARWSQLGPDAQRSHLAQHEAIADALAAAMSAGRSVESDEVQALVARHHAWVSLFWTPDSAAYRGMAQMYVDDPRFRATYDAHADGTAAYLRDAIEVFVARQ